MHRWLIIALLAPGCTDSIPADTGSSDPVVAGDDSDASGLDVSVDGIDFGEQQLGAQAAPRDVYLTNTTALPIEFLEVVAIPEDQGFYLGNDPTGTRVEPGATRRVQVRWRPLRRGGHGGELVIDTSANPVGQPLRLPMAGFGTAGALRLDPAELVFSRDAASRVAVILSNEGDAVVRLTGGRVEGDPGVRLDLDPGRNGELPIELPPTDPELGVPVRTIFVEFDPELHAGGASARVVLLNDGYLDTERVLTVTVEGD
jgi:hypothetical protein